jgi:hypothetical protein
MSVKFIPKTPTKKVRGKKMVATMAKAVSVDVAFASP